MLYLGTTKPNGLVSPSEWQRFLKDSVTPRFPQGLSVWQAAGQWRNKAGVIVSESSRVLDLVHKDDEQIDKSVLEIIDSYKLQFQQESVLRIKNRVCVSF